MQALFLSWPKAVRCFLLSCLFTLITFVLDVFSMKQITNEGDY